MIEELIAAPEPKPVAWIMQNRLTQACYVYATEQPADPNHIQVPVYTAPPAPEPEPSVPDADLVRDAERYRWLRTYNTAKHPAVTEAFFLGDENLDAEIDAAIAAEKGGA